ncbi:MAG TPA: YfhO family protein, partial [Isosphaeraceae bacterium]
FGSWHPELLPSLVVREAYGTRARGTDWMNGYYPYHEMNAYVGLIALALAVVGAAACRDRWVAFWTATALLGGLLMLGRFTFLFDSMNHVPIMGSSRIPVRFDLWVALAVAALAAVGVDRLSRPGAVDLRPALALAIGLVAVSIPIVVYVYLPAWTEARRWEGPGHVEHFRWLGREVAIASVRSLVLVIAAWVVARAAARSGRPEVRRRLASVLPVLVLVDLLASHWADAPTIDPSYWTVPPPTVDVLKSDPTLRRIHGEGAYGRSAGEPGYASRPIDFFSIRDSLAWSLAPVWGLRSSNGATPLIPRRMVTYSEGATGREGRFAIEGVSHVLAHAWLKLVDPKPLRVGSVLIHRLQDPEPRARLMGRPVYASGELDALAKLRSIGTQFRSHVVVEDPDRPLREDAAAAGSATITVDDPERVEVVTASDGPAYLVLADTFDPGWSATVDGRPAPIRPAFVAFRAVALPAGSHRVAFSYRPAGFTAGLVATAFGVLASLGCLAWPRRVADLAPSHAVLGWPRRWPLFAAIAIVAVVGASAVRIGPDGTIGVHPRCQGMFHTFTWGAGIEAIPETRDALGR